jgi:hypothetical protein
MQWRTGRNGPEREAPRRRIAVLLSIAIGFLLVVGVAVATPGMGILSAPVHARGTAPDKLIINSKSGVHLKTKDSTDFVTQQIVIAGGGHTGWHSHPGPVLVTIKRGAMRLIYANDPTCTGTVYEPGDSFVDRGDAVVHIARNESLLNELEFWATYLVPGDPGAAFRLDEPAPSECG